MPSARLPTSVSSSGSGAEAVQHGLRCLAFCGTRKLSELVLQYAREALAASAPELVPTLAAYRAARPRCPRAPATDAARE